jgi:hypothetical protein
MYKLGAIIIVFLLGVYFCMNYSSKDAKEGFDIRQRCPNILIQKGKNLYLYNSRLARVPGVNPVKFNNLEDYVEFIDWQRSQGIRCEVLFLQHSYDTQGKPIYKIRPSPTDLQGGLPPTVALGRRVAPQVKLFDAGRDDPPYNENSYPAYDQMNQYIGDDTPLDKMFHEQQVRGQCSDNPMDSNWCGVKYSEASVKSGKYAKDEVYEVGAPFIPPGPPKAADIIAEGKYIHEAAKDNLHDKKD